jgi:hypothetical protein
MHNAASTLVVLMLVGVAATARAQDIAAPLVSTAAPSPARLELGITLLPMGLGRFRASPGGMTFTTDAAFSYGLGVSAAYVVLPGLSLGIAPQALFNVKPKDQNDGGAQEFDLMARAAYSRPVIDTIDLYVEVLPGYSLIHPPDGDTARGLVVGFGGGAIMHLSDRWFTNLGLGYQVGLQKLPAKDMSADVNTRYLRVALGAGTRF